MKAIITGATGMVGKGVLLECLDHPEISEVLSISRRSIELKHPKLKELIHKDFSEFASVKDQLAGYDACYACMGVSSMGMDEAKYTELTYEYTLSLAKQLHSINPDMTFIYVSGQGTDSSEKGRSMWARVKGKTENDVIKLGFKQAFAFRPGGIIPERGVEPRSKATSTALKYFKWLLYVIRVLAPKSIVSTSQIGHAMIQITFRGYAKAIINPADIHNLTK